MKVSNVQIKTLSSILKDNDVGNHSFISPAMFFTQETEKQF